MNLWAVSFLVMYFSWKSDHCTSRLGRRTPFVLLSLPFLICAVVLFPLFSEKWVLVGLMVVYYFFNDMSASTYPLLSIDFAKDPTGGKAWYAGRVYAPSVTFDAELHRATMMFAGYRTTSVKDAPTDYRQMGYLPLIQSCAN